MATARFYRADKNKEEASFPGVPLRDLDEDEFAALPDWLKASVDASEMYQKTNPNPQHRQTKETVSDG